VRKKGLWVGLLLLLLLLPASTVWAGDPGIIYDNGRIFVDEDVSLEPGETFNGDLGVFNGNLTVPQGSLVNGDVFVTNGDAEIDGQISGSVAVISGDYSLGESGLAKGDVFTMSGDQEISGRVTGDVSVLFGNIDLKDTAIVDGNVIVLSGSLHRAEGAQVRGDEMREIPLPEMPLIRERLQVPEIREVPVPSELPPLPDLPVPPSRPRIQVDTPAQQFGRFVGRVVAAAFFGLIFIALGTLIVIIWPRATRRVTDCIATMPLQSFALGLLTFLIALVLEALAMVLMILIIMVAAALISTIILIPIGLLLILLSVLVLLPVPLALAAGMVLGWIALAELVGRQAIRMLKAGQVQSLGATLVGLIISVSVATLLWLIAPLCCGWPFVVLLTSIGLGAVFHTRFGTQSCGQSQPLVEPELLPAEAMDEEAGMPDQAPGNTP
jgi:cytoskeletal protein CcmA (bactofilin family)